MYYNRYPTHNSNYETASHLPAVYNGYYCHQQLQSD